MGSKKGLVVVFVVLVALIALASAAYGVLAPRARQAVQTEQATNASSEPDAALSQDAQGVQNTDGQAGSDSQIKLPDFTVTDAEGNEVTLASMQGRPTVMIYWATWCPPCVQESPEIQKLYEAYGDQVNFMMVNAADSASESPETVTEWMAEQGYTFPVYFDTMRQAQAAGQVYYLPTLFALDAQGNVLVSRSGALDEQTGQELLESLVEGQ